MGTLDEDRQSKIGKKSMRNQEKEKEEAGKTIRNWNVAIGKILDKRG